MAFRIRSVNWRSGLPFRPEFFHGERFALEERLRWLTYHAVDGYGLVASDGGVGALNVRHRVSDDQRKLSLTVVRCCAVAPDGTPVFVTPTEEGGAPSLTPDDYELSDDEEAPIHVFLEMPGPNVIAHGELDAGEVGGQQWCYPAYRVVIERKTPAGADNLLEIARFVWKDGRLVEDEEFFPPCLTVAADERILHYVNTAAEELRTCAEDTVRHLHSLQESRPKEQSSFFFATQFALLVSQLSSYLTERASWLSPMEVVAQARSFTRAVLILLESHPRIQDGVWSQFLSKQGTPDCSDPTLFRNRLADATASKIEPDSVHLTLPSVMRICRLISNFGAYLASSAKVPPPISAGTLVYQDEAYAQQAYAGLEYHANTKSIEVCGLTPMRGGRALVWLSIKDPQQRSQAHSLKVGESPTYVEMKRRPVDTDAHAPVVIIPMDLDPLKTVDRLFISSPSMDLRPISTNPDDDLRIYHLEES